MTSTSPGSVTTTRHSSLIQRSPRRPYVPGVREPYVLPTQEIEIPAPGQTPREPPAFNFLTLLTPLLTTGASLAMRYTMFSSTPQSAWIMYVMMGASAVHPISNIISVFTKRSAYKKAVEEREAAYQEKLESTRKTLENLAHLEFNTLLHAYPTVNTLCEIALARGRQSRLWFRRLGVDSDFMSLRLGTFSGPPSFEVSLPRFSSSEDPLKGLSEQLTDGFSRLGGLPFLVDFDQVGSLGLASSEVKQIYQVARRLLIDALVHHSPDDLKIFLLTDREEGTTNWEWLKWAPHCGALTAGNNIPQLVYQKNTINQLVRWLVQENEKRTQEDFSDEEVGLEYPSILVVVDDRGKIRQLPELTRIVKWGHETRIHTLFLGEENLPQIRARLDLKSGGKFRYAETWEGGKTEQGTFETADIETTESIARALAGLETLGGKVITPLPSSLPLSETIDQMAFSTSAVNENWQQGLQDKERLQFPIGVHVTPDGLASLQINLLPAERGGFDAYHSILIGTTGSGKSEFMKSVVLGAAFRYSPKELNFFFLDFKGGAAFDPFKELPHVIGVVTNLQPELVDRGLTAVQSEIARRQEQFSQAGVRDIWAFNQQSQDRKMPHLWLLLDEFAKGLADFPQLREVLDLLVRQGRSLGMYLLLANQDVSSAVDNLLSNVGWRIALKVARRDELSQLLEEKRNPTIRPGHGYLRTLNGEILEFQSGYAGFPAPTDNPLQTRGFEIHVIEPDGRSLGEPVYKYDPSEESLAAVQEKQESEQNVLVALMLEATEDLSLEKARPIYLDPLPDQIPLSDILKHSPVYREFSSGQWSKDPVQDAFLKIPVGMLDYLEFGVQKPLEIPFDSKDGHLWMAGAPGSGKESSLISLLLSIAITHTPEEAQIYILDCGSGSLRSLEQLPHVGSVIRLPEKERVDRLLSLIDGQINQRQLGGNEDQEQGASNLPRIFLVVNNFGELKQSHLDVLDRIAGFVQGGRVGIHLILVSSLVRDIPSKISNNISRRIILQMASKDELLSAVGYRVPPLSARSQGRGYWVNETLAECQLAAPLLARAGSESIVWKDFIPELAAGWQGEIPLPIKTLPEQIPLTDEQILQIVEKEPGILVGYNYQDLELMSETISASQREWLILGGPRSGKSNFLLTLAELFSHEKFGGWQISALSLRPSPLRRFKEFLPGIQLYTDVTKAQSGLENLCARLENESALSGNHLLLIDDLGSVFQAGSPDLEKALDRIASLNTIRDQADLLIFAAGTLQDFRSKAGTNSLIRVFSQNKTGLCLSQDMSDWSWLGAAPQNTRAFQKLSCPPGRGYFINRGQPAYVQTCWAKKYF